MIRFVALFRGINVGKAKRIAMADLRALLESLGYLNVRTLLNSGNAVFDSPKTSASSHAKAIRAAVAAQLGVDALVIVKSARDIDAAIAGNTIGAIATDPSRLIIAVTDNDAALAMLKPVTTDDAGGDIFRLGTDAAYLWCANGILESRLATQLLKALATGTTRNAATMDKIQALMRCV